jgi:hypothetical protein
MRGSPCPSSRSYVQFILITPRRENVRPCDQLFDQCDSVGRDSNHMRPMNVHRSQPGKTAVFRPSKPFACGDVQCGQHEVGRQGARRDLGQDFGQTGDDEAGGCSLFSGNRHHKAGIIPISRMVGESAFWAATAFFTPNTEADMGGEASFERVRQTMLVLPQVYGLPERFGVN